MAQNEKAKKVLVGVPVSLSGKETEQTHKSLAFIEQLQAALGKEVSVESVDETLSTKEAQKMIAHDGSKPEDEHAEAARLILADYLKLQSAQAAPAVAASSKNTDSLEKPPF